jgi:hypothetical protein
VPVVVGLPSGDLFEAADRGEFVLGGCVVFPGPTARWACPRCERALWWGGQPRAEIDIAPPVAAVTRIATWNLRECPHPGYAKGAEVFLWQEMLSADIWLLTEVHRDWDAFDGWVAASPPRGGDTPDTKRWAGIQTRLPMTQLFDQCSDRPAAEESLCLARIDLPDGAPAESVLVACSVLPWGGAGRYWPGLPENNLDDQQAFVLEHHAHRIAEARIGDEPIIWGGDFNQELRDLPPEQKAAGHRLAGTTAGIERLRGAFSRFGLQPVTEASEHLDRAFPSIDHLAVSEPLAAGEAVVFRPTYEDDRLLSDHAAYVADVRLEIQRATSHA